MKGLFWGIFLIGAGLILLIKHIFKLNISSGRAIIGLFILCIGLNIIIGSNVTNRGFIFNFNNTSNKGEYNVIFNSGTIDLSSVESNRGTVEINVVFGSAEIILPEDREVKIQVNSAFASTQLPDGNKIVFGNGEYLHSPDDAEGKSLRIEINTVFGSTEIKNYFKAM